MLHFRVVQLRRSGIPPQQARPFVARDGQLADAAILAGEQRNAGVARPARGGFDECDGARPG
jgi:hypothetical protein